MAADSEVTVGNDAVVVEARIQPKFVAGLGGDARAYHDALMALAVLLRGFLRGRLARLASRTAARPPQV